MYFAGFVPNWRQRPMLKITAATLRGRLRNQMRRQEGSIYKSAPCPGMVAIRFVAGSIARQAADLLLTTLHQ